MTDFLSNSLLMMTTTKNGSIMAEKLFYCPWCLYEGPCRENFKVHLGSHLNIQPVTLPPPPSQPLTSSSCGCPHEVGCPFFTPVSLQNQNLESTTAVADDENEQPEKMDTTPSEDDDDEVKAESFSPVDSPLITSKSGQLQKKTKKEKKVGDKLIHSCPHCPYTNPTLANLSRHLLSHTGEKPFDCPDCDYKSSISSNMKRHIVRMHTEREKNYNCDLCPYAGFTKIDLRNHISRTHKEEKLCHYVCPFPDCQYVAVSPLSLHNHERKHQNQKNKIYEDPTPKSMTGLKNYEKKQKLRISTKFLFPRKSAEAAAAPGAANKSGTRPQGQGGLKVKKMAVLSSKLVNNCEFICLNEEELAIYSNQVKKLPKIRTN